MPKNLADLDPTFAFELIEALESGLAPGSLIASVSLDPDKPLQITLGDCFVALETY